MILYIYAGSPEPLLLGSAISTKISCAGAYVMNEKMFTSTPLTIMTADVISNLFLKKMHCS